MQDVRWPYCGVPVEQRTPLHSHRMPCSTSSPRPQAPRQGRSHCPAPGHAARAHGICIVTISMKFISQMGLGAPGQKRVGGTHYPGSTRAWPSRPPATHLGSPPPHPGQSPHPLPTMAFRTLSDLQKSVCHAGYNEVALSPLALKKKKETGPKHISQTPYGCATMEHEAPTLVSSPLLWSNTRGAFISVKGL